MHKRKCFSRILALFLFIGLILGSGMEAKALVIDFRLPSDIEIVVDKQEVTLGEKVQIRIETSANSSELGDEAYVAYVNDDGLVKKVKEIKLSKEANSFVGNIQVDEDFIIGLWKIDFVVVTKSDNNSAVMYNDAVHNFTGDGVNYINMSNGNILVKEFASYELFEDIAVSLSNVKMLDTEKITISANGENVALESEAYALYTLENEFGVFEKEVKLLLDDNNEYVGEVVIDESFRPGVWKLSYIILMDKSGHREIVYNKELHGNTVNNNFKDLSKGNFTVDRDMYGPVIGDFSKIRLNDLEEKYLITVEVSDESDLYEKAYVKYVSQHNGQVLEKDVLLELVDGRYQGIFQRQDYNAWNVDFILFKDIEGNTSCVYNSELHLINSMDLSALNILEDDKAPTVEKIEVKNLEVNGEYEIIVTPSEDESQLSSKAYVVYEAVDGDIRLEEEIILTLENGVYIGKFKPEESVNPLLWQISHIILSDMKNNIGIYYNNNIHGSVKNAMDTSAGDFNTNGEDAVGPTLKGIESSQEKREINKEQIKVEVKLAITAEDSMSELGQDAYVLYRSNNGKSREVKLTLNEDGIYEGSMLLFEENEGEDWFIDYLILADEMNNRTIIYNSDIHGIGESFQGQNIKVEGVNLVLNSINVDTSEVNSLRAAIITAEVQGINGEGRGYILFVDQNGAEKEVTLSGDNGILKGTLHGITDGEWMMSYIIVGDMKGNRKVLYNSEIHSDILPSTDLSVYNIVAKADVPTISEISVESNTLVLYDNESTKIKIKASDSSGLGDVAYVKYMGEGFEQEVKLKLIGGHYEGVITVNSEMPEGIIKIDYVILKDKDNNTSVLYNSQIHGFGEDLSAADISIENPELGMSILGVNVEKSVVEYGEEVGIEVKVSKGVFNLNDKAYLRYVQVENDMLTEKEILLEKAEEFGTKVSFSTELDTTPMFGANITVTTESTEVATYRVFEDGYEISSEAAKVNETTLLFPKPVVGDEIVVKFYDASKSYVGEATTTVGGEGSFVIDEEEVIYRGSFKTDNIRNLGNWKVDYVLFSDQYGNTKINYNSEINTIGTEISSGDIRVGDLVVHDVIDSTILKGIDFVSKFVIKNYSDTDRNITLVVEVKDTEGNLLSKFKVNKRLNSNDYDIIDSRVRINEEAKFVDIYVLDENGDKLYDILDNYIIEE